MPFSCSAAARACGLLLLAGEAVLAVLALGFPRVPANYADFYIRHRRGCWLAPQAEPAAAAALKRQDIDPDVLSQATACFLFENGWSLTPPFNATRQAATSSWLVLPAFPGAKALELTLADGSPASPQQVRLGLAGGALVRLTLPPGGAPVQVRLPLQGQASGLIRVQLLRPVEPDGNPTFLLRLRWLA